MKILALDIATNLGIAVGDAGGDPRAWSVNLGKPPDDRRFSNALRVTSALLQEHTPDLVALEAPVGGPKTSHYLVGLVACVRGVVANRKCPVLMCNIASVRKVFTGRAWTTRDFPHLKRAAAKNAIKGKVIETCRQMKWDVSDDDAADAAATWFYAGFLEGMKTPLPGGELFQWEGAE